MDEVLEAVVILVLFVLLSLFLIKLGWAMFMVPVFNVADLTWMQALGFSLLASSFRGASSRK